MTVTNQQETDRQFALMLSRAYDDDQDDYYAGYNFTPTSPNKSHPKRKSSSHGQEDPEWNPDGKKTKKMPKKTKEVKNVKSENENMDSVMSAVEAIMSFKSSSSAAPSECNLDMSEQPFIPVKKKLVMDGLNTGKFTSEEVRKFEEGLGLYGRDWGKLVQHIGTRDSHSIRSHAQKYFIKLYRDNRPLPPKVAETGHGYTLSGKPLDPDSAAAKPYLRGYKRPKNLQNASSGFVKQTPPSQTAPPSSEQPQLPTQDKENESIEKSKSPVKKTRRKSSVSQLLNSSQDEFDPESINMERTDYSKSRPVRLSAKPKMETLTFSGYDDENAHRMIPCEKYVGTPGSGMGGAQPFQIKVQRKAMIMMDLHAHLLKTEVIGFLAGKWDPKERLLEVDTAIPCRSVEHGDHLQVLDRHTNVELDPASEVEMREMVDKQNLRVVGWYHSHPTFLPNPSLIDLVNQKNYQAFFRSAAPPQPQESPLLDSYTSSSSSLTISEPFVGVIVGPYDPHLPKSISAFNWFNVGNREEDMNRPKHLVYDCKDIVNEIENQELEKMIKLLRECYGRGDVTDFTSGWRQDRWETKLEKLRASLWFYATGSTAPVPPTTSSLEPYLSSSSTDGHVVFTNVLNELELEISKWTCSSSVSLSSSTFISKE